MNTKFRPAKSDYRKILPMLALLPLCNPAYSGEAVTDAQGNVVGEVISMELENINGVPISIKLDTRYGVRKGSVGIGYDGFFTLTNEPLIFYPKEDCVGNPVVNIEALDSAVASRDPVFVIDEDFWMFSSSSCPNCGSSPQTKAASYLDAWSDCMNDLPEGTYVRGMRIYKVMEEVYEEYELDFEIN